MSSEHIIDQLKSHIGSLEQRINTLEGKLGRGGSSAASGADAMRMILIGPPGAGMLDRERPIAYAR